MAGLLVSGPAGAGKSERARQALEVAPGPAILVEFQEIYASLLGIKRLPSGRYPERRDRDDYALPLTEYVRRAAITSARERDIYIIATNSDGLPERRTALLGFLGPGASEIVVDPGEDEVIKRLSVRGRLSRQCERAKDRWYRPRERGFFGGGRRR